MVTEMTGESYVFDTHSLTFKVGYQTVIHAGPVMSPSIVVDIKKPDISANSNIPGPDPGVVRTGDRAIITFKFMRPQFIYPGIIFVFRDGTVKGFGAIESVKLTSD